ncbi:adenylyltransferase/cytidyltransferase family protein [Nocardioides aurantiacus]|uniref:Glycerol-3-phosphate cytidylyltransferase n=1 Tax=Nocardioides aurantiacus TaxID=86796 RepID=A0A3N2CTH3_9ACTN|nr:adenylyltransferase/cytidyltransferase family protein [Nocardioides aurantiacus]ROR90514.1 glycerol-3-phosphate cytidylyltransferase [Nocardioides aurantiacus]
MTLYRVGYASGVFDMFHVGHLNILHEASQRCDLLVVGVATDEYVVRLKGVPPVIPFIERTQIIAALRVADEVVADSSADKRLAWERRPFDAIFKGDDWKDAPKGLALEREMSSIGVDVVYFPYTVHTSSTKLRAFLDLHLDVERGAG